MSKNLPYILTLDLDPEVPSVNENQISGGRSCSSCSSVQDNGLGLLPAQPNHPPRPKILIELIPFASLLSSLANKLRRGERQAADFVVNSNYIDNDGGPQLQAKFSGSSGKKFRPIVAGGGTNTPLTIIHCLSEWFSALEARDTVPSRYLGLRPISMNDECLVSSERLGWDVYLPLNIRR